MSRHWAGRQGTGSSSRGRGRGGGRGYISPFFSKNKESNWEKDLQRNLREWGIDPDLDDASKQFWDTMMEHIRDIQDGKLISSQPPDCPMLLPWDPVDAMREVIEQEVLTFDNPGGTYQVRDRLEVEFGCPGVPPPFRFEKRTCAYALRPAFLDAPTDPLIRFEYSRASFKATFTQQLLTEGSVWSLAVRAIVAHYACHFAKCVHCGHTNTLRWNGYDNMNTTNEHEQFRYWKKLICENCASVYEIKSAKNIEMVMQKFRYGINGGKFLFEYAAIQKSLPIGAKQYVAIMSEGKEEEEEEEDGGVPDQKPDDAAGDGGRGSTWPVYVAAVDHVVPTLRNRSFYLEASHPKVYTKIMCNAEHAKFWFRAPYFDYDARELAAETIELLED